MDRIQELLTRQSELADGLNAIQVLADQEGRDLNDVEHDQVQARFAELETIKAEIARRQRIQEVNASLSVSRGRKTSDALPYGPTQPPTPATPIGGPPTFANMFGQARDSSGFRAGDFLQVLASGRHDPRMVMDAATISDDASGGYLVPSPLVASMLDGSLSMEIVRPRARNFAMTAKTLAVVGLDSVDRSAGLVGRLAGQWLAEAATATLTDVPKFSQVLLDSTKLAVFTSASLELVQDAMGFQREVTAAFSAAFAYNLDAKFLFGSGSNQPLGCLNDSNGALITVSGETGQASNQILFKNIVKMWAALSPGSHSRAVWLAAPEALPSLLSMTITVSDASGGIVSGIAAPITQDASGALFILGRPVISCEHMQALGSKGDLALVDFNAYAVGMRNGVSMDTSIHVGWSTGSVAFRGLLRVDGRPLLSAPVSLPDASSPPARFVSPFVTLEDRTGTPV